MNRSSVQVLPSLVASDLDGTLLDPHGHITPRTLTVLRRLHDAGVPLVVTTGRPIRWLADLSPIADLSPHVVCSNGAVRVNLTSGVIEEQHCLDGPTALCVAEELRAAEPSVTFAVEMGERWGHEPGFLLRDDLAGDVVAPLPELLSQPVVKLLVVSDALDTVTLARTLQPLVGDRLEATYSVAATRGLLEISAPGVSKASSLRRLCSELGVDPADAVAFGDMPNDRAMLRFVGHGYVMANGDAGMLGEGFRLAPSHADDGVAQVLERLLGVRSEARA